MVCKGELSAVKAQIAKNLINLLSIFFEDIILDSHFTAVKFV